MHLNSKLGFVSISKLSLVNDKVKRGTCFKSQPTNNDEMLWSIKRIRSAAKLADTGFRRLVNIVLVPQIYRYTHTVCILCVYIHTVCVISMVGTTPY